MEQVVKHRFLVTQLRVKPEQQMMSKTHGLLDFLNLIAGVYLGYDTPRPLGKGTGSYTAARVFSDFMTPALANQKNQPFSVPDGLHFVRVNRSNGVAATRDPNGVIITEAFKANQGPNQPAEPQTVVITETGETVKQSAPQVGGVF